jgi:hypothetical protein
MNITNREIPLLDQLRTIIETMRNAGKKPLRIHCTWGQLQAIRTELAARGHHMNAADLSIFGIPINLDPAGSGLWVSCISTDENPIK